MISIDAAGPQRTPRRIDRSLDRLVAVVAIVIAISSGIGAAALGVYVWRVARSRAAWTTDHPWHAFAIGGLVSAIAWFSSAWPSPAAAS